MNIIPVPLNTLRAAYVELARRVHVALMTQRGDAARLSEHHNECLRLLHLAHQHETLFDHEEFSTLEESVQNMISCLDEASHQSSDPPDFDFGPTTSHISTGLPGHPRINIDPELLNIALELRGPTHLAAIFNCHPRTIRRRALEHGLVDPGQPVYVDYEAGDGTVSRIYRSSTTSGSNISDEELDQIVSYILTCFPTFGRRMIDDHLKYLGHHISRAHLQASYNRVHGAPTNIFGTR
ncbi:hypothetical protein C0993_011278 [Termitomyces sp. T159_Od127]|nr:hypothetical protein C0993_011278 [Termitomyces sp. T159_Od127]